MTEEENTESIREKGEKEHNEEEKSRERKKTDKAWWEFIISQVSHTINVYIDILLRNIIENISETKPKQHLKRQRRKRLKTLFKCIFHYKTYVKNNKNFSYFMK